MPPSTSNRLYTPLSLRNQGFSRGMGGGNDLEAVKRGISYVETRGAPDAYTKKGVQVSKGMYAGDRALGKYQVMGKNVGPWTKQYLGREVSPEEYLASPDIQEKLADARMGELLQQYGNPEDVASVWFTGQPLAKAGGSVADDTGTSNAAYQDIFKQGMAMAGDTYQSASQGLQGFGQSIGNAVRKYTPLALRTAQGIPEAAGNLAMGAVQQTGRGLGMILDGMDMENKMDTMTLPGGSVAPKIDPSGMVGSTVRTAKGGLEAAPTMFQGFQDLSTKLLEKLKGRSTVSRQFIEDATNMPELKQTEKDVIRRVLEDEGDTVDVPSFAEKVKAELLPLERSTADKAPGGRAKIVETTRYENVNLPDELRGPVANYSEHIYQSPIKTSAGGVHFSGMNEPERYFGHTRVEDLPDNGTRRVIEVQSDLFQKGRLEGEYDKTNTNEAARKYLEKQAAEGYPDGLESFNKRKAALDSLSPYKNNASHFRMIREEVKQAAIDGKTKLQFPTGETAMKIEGLGTAARWSERGNDGVVFDITPDDLRVGMSVTDGGAGYGNDWIITDVLGDGKFKAVPRNVDDAEKAWTTIKDTYSPPSNQRYLARNSQTGDITPFSTPKEADEYIAKEVANARRQYAEEFDISGKVDTENPIYKFYEKEVGKYLKNKYDAKLMTDPQGVKWWEIPVKKEYAKMPVEAFVGIGAVGLGASAPAINREREEN